MKITYPNGIWPAYIEGVVINELNDNDIQKIGQLIVQHTVVVIKGPQNLSIEDELGFARRIGTLNEFPKFNSYGKDSIKFEKFWNAIHRESPYIDSVTAELNSDGLPGMHSMKDELGWHCDSPWNKNRTDIISLYAVRGSAGSQTVYLNGAMAFADLTDEWKERARGLHLQLDRAYGNYSKTGELFDIDTDFSSQVLEYNPLAVYTNKCGIECLYIPFNQILRFVELKDDPEENIRVLEYFKQHLTQEKYQYTHNWEDGDYLVWDNWNGLHYRPQFEAMENRLLHRMQFNSDNIHF